MTTASDPRTTDAAAIEPDALRRALASRVPDAASSPDVRIVRAPGRANLIGEHTDYNQGLVLPAAIDLEIRMAVLPTDDRRVEVTLLATGERTEFSLDDLPPDHDEWPAYVAGVAWSLTAAGIPIRGFRAVLASTLPVSAGLSSSAALELASAWALLDPPSLEAVGIDGMKLAQLAQRAENEYVGVRSGLMDQFASSLGRRGAAMLLDCRSLEYRPVRLPLEEHVIVVIDSASPRRLESSEYNARRAQCEEAVAVIAESDPDVKSLRDVDLHKLAGVAGRLDEVTVRRCEHVIRENERVVGAVKAFESGDFASIGKLFAASHASLRDLYEVSSPELDALVEIATSVPGVVGARMTGAGFGGCTVNVVARDAVDSLRAAVARDYPARTGLEARVFVVEPVDGAGVMA
jgi:galactokinase